MNERKHLVSAEVEKLLVATKGSRNGARDRCLLLLMFRHGLRVSEACGLQLSQVDIESHILESMQNRGRLSRNDIVMTTADEFNAELDALLDKHCSCV
jgi:type 1 fimbriae regulatory protein FimB